MIKFLKASGNKKILLKKNSKKGELCRKTNMTFGFHENKIYRKQ